MKPGIATIALRKYDVFHALDLAAEAGFMGVEIWGRSPHMPEDFDEQHMKNIRCRVKSNGLEVSMIGSYANPASPDFDQRAENALRAAKMLNTRLIRVWAGNKEPHEAEEENWVQAANAFHEYALRAEYDGITLAMEMHCGTLSATPEGVLKLIEMAQAPNLKLNYQVADMENPDVERVIGFVSKYVVNVHAQNFKRCCCDNSTLKLCRIEKGIVDYNLVLSLLKEHGFNGYVEVEFLKGENVCDELMLESLKKDADYLRTLTARYS